MYAFQTRNPTHAGHAYLMKSAGKDLKKQGYKNPVLWLSPLGGWTKEDDVPLDVRVKQHHEVLKAGTSHPGGLDPDKVRRWECDNCGRNESPYGYTNTRFAISATNPNTLASLVSQTVMAIWPSPMVYAGPTEVQFHAKSRRSAGASYFVVGRDPAGMKGSMEAVAHQDDDLYNGDHGRYVLQMSPGIGDMKMLSFVKVMYDVKSNSMTLPDENRMEDFISISGTKMRTLARQQAVPCPDHVPTDLLGENCVPNGFMVPKGWDIVTDYYSHIDTKEWVPWSRPIVTPNIDAHKTHSTGTFGSNSFSLKLRDGSSFWHSIPLWSNPSKNMINFITEIPMYVTAKMEVDKSANGNAIKQDKNKDGSPRYYTYGTPFFNYGLIPQTWEDPYVFSDEGYGGDNDPLDVIEVGTSPLPMGSVTPCRVLGSLELIDDGETDHKILCVAEGSDDFDRIHSVNDLESHRPGTIKRLVHWLKYYKTSDGKGVNELGNEERPTSVNEAVDIIEETNGYWKALCEDKDDHVEGFVLDGCS